MSQAYERPKTPTRFQGGATTQQRTIETSPFKEGRQNDRYANPSMVSNDVFYEKHYDNPNKQLTPVASPLGIPPNGYGKLNDYKDRYKQISGGAGESVRGPATPTANKDQTRGQLRDSYQNRSDRGNITPTRSQLGGTPSGYRGAPGARTPTRRNDPHHDLVGQEEGRRTPMRGDRTPSDQYRSKK